MIKENRKKNTPFFSVIINCHNSERYVGEALKSVLSQTIQDYELIVFDNASSDDTAKIVKSFGRDIRYYFSDVKLSLGAARNKAVMKARGKYIAFLDSDDVWLPTKLDTQKIILTERGLIDEIGLCGSDAFRVSRDLSPLARYSLSRVRYRGSVLISLLHDCFIPMSSAVVNRKICIAVGGFDESFEIIEEWDLWIRIAQHFEVIYYPDCLVKIRFHESNTSKNYVDQNKEILRMLNAVELSAKVEQRVIDSARASWFLRYLIVDFFNSFHKTFRYKANLIWQIFIILLRQPKTCFAVLRSYFSIRLVRFAFAKYKK
ncbi:glycosyltransferase [bacterium]|nr:glycosyltransferase [bacterium]